MALRLILLIITAALVLAGCTNHRSHQRPAKRISVPAGKPVVTRQLPAPSARPVQLARYAARPAAPYTLDSGDRLRVTVFGQENLSRTYAVDAGGFISLPLIGAVEARGATTYELEKRISSSLKRKYVKDPKVTVEIETYRPFFILGEVTSAGQYPYVADMTVQTAVAIAGGFTARAKKKSVQLTRRVNGATVSQTVPVTWKVRPGDTITVKERFF